MSGSVATLMPWRYRKRAYIGFTLAVVLVAGAASGFASISLPVPDALVFAGAFLNVVGAGLGIVAASSGPPSEDDTESVARRMLDS